MIITITIIIIIIMLIGLMIMIGPTWQIPCLFRIYCNLMKKKNWQIRMCCIPIRCWFGFNVKCILIVQYWNSIHGQDKIKNSYADLVWLVCVQLQCWLLAVLLERIFQFDTWRKCQANVQFPTISSANFFPDLRGDKRKRNRQFVIYNLFVTLVRWLMIFPANISCEFFKLDIGFLIRKLLSLPWCFTIWLSIIISIFGNFLFNLNWSSTSFCWPIKPNIVKWLV